MHKPCHFYLLLIGLCYYLLFAFLVCDGQAVLCLKLCLGYLFIYVLCLSCVDILVLTCLCHACFLKILAELLMSQYCALCIQKQIQPSAHIMGELL